MTLKKSVNFTEDCESISKIEFDRCNSINNTALSELNILKDYLKNLKINGCVNVSDHGIMSLEELR